MIENGQKLAAAAEGLAQNYKTIYALGCFGWPMTKANQDRAIASYAYNAREARAKLIRAADAETFAFDCVGFIKALLWGWTGDAAKNYGGATYASNGVPDKSANQMMALCRDVDTDFSGIQVGEVVWMKGHIGIYIGSGKAVECTPKWSGGVQITQVWNLGKDSHQGRTWTSHGKLPWISYEERYDLPLPVLHKGIKGDAVTALQHLLIGRGCSCGKHGADGSFGGATQAAVKVFQTKMGLEADGVVGPETMAKLLGVAP